ncbi:hypothetical protein KHA80_21040 [Anaerobacillus sp. HL2]|nr:hypothetical protein KHA80_21040 [Anaerobacillus sp. HL2]
MTEKEALKKGIYGVSVKRLKKSKKSFELVVLFVRMLTVAGNYGDLGVDVIVDINQKVWILEVNKLHDHKYPLYALEDEQMYLK